MADFRKAGTPLNPAFKLLTIHVNQKVQVDFFSDKSIKNIDELWLAYFGSAAEWKEIKSPMPKAIRRLELKGKTPGMGVLIAAPSLISFGVNMLLFNRSLFPLLHAELQVEVKFSREQQFIEDLAVQGKAAAQEFQLPMSIMIGQACVESLYGRGPHMPGKNSLYGITKMANLRDDWYPLCNKIAAGITTAIKGQNPVGDRFCRADSWAEAVRIWGQYVTKHPGSRSVQGLFKKGPWTRAELEQLAGHMSSLNFGKGHTKEEYRKLVMDIVDDYDLTRFDPK
jgi:hypothetical protein